MILLWNKIKAKVNLLVFAILFSLTGACAMSENLELIWEWPAGRIADQRVLIRIEKIIPKSSGLFGLGKSPSIADNLPGPVVLIGEVLQDEALIGMKLKISLPKVEAEFLGSGDYAVVGIVDKNTCICIVKVTSQSEDISKLSCP